MKRYQTELMNIIIISILSAIAFSIIYMYNQNATKSNQIYILDQYFNNLKRVLESSSNVYEYINISFNPPVDIYSIKKYNKTLYFYVDYLNYNNSIDFSNFEDMYVLIYINRNGTVETKILSDNEIFIVQKSSNASVYIILKNNITYREVPSVGPSGGGGIGGNNNAGNQNSGGGGSNNTSNQTTSNQTSDCGGLPTKFTKWLDYIYDPLPFNQENCGNCWAVANAQLATLVYRIANGYDKNNMDKTFFSPQEITECCNYWTSGTTQECLMGSYACDGGTVSAAISYGYLIHIASTKDYPVKLVTLQNGIPNLNWQEPKCKPPSNVKKFTPQSVVDKEIWDIYFLIYQSSKFDMKDLLNKLDLTCLLKKLVTQQPYEVGTYILLYDPNKKDFVRDSSGKALVFVPHALVLVGYTDDSDFCEQIYGTKKCFIFLNSWGKPGSDKPLVITKAGVKIPYNLDRNGLSYFPEDFNITKAFRKYNPNLPYEAYFLVAAYGTYLNPSYK